MLGKSDRKQLRAAAPAFAPGMALKQMAKHSLDFWLTSEDLPDSDNRVLLNTQGDIALHYTVNNDEGHARLTAKPKWSRSRTQPPNRIDGVRRKLIQQSGE